MKALIWHSAINSRKTPRPLIYLARRSGTPVRKSTQTAPLFPPPSSSPMAPTTISVTLSPSRSLMEGSWSPWLNVLLPFAAVGTSLLMIRFLRLIRPGNSKDNHLSAGLWLPWMFVVMLVIFAVWSLAEARLAVSKALDPNQNAVGCSLAGWSQCWPLQRFYFHWRKSQRKIEQIIPAGDILVIVDRISLDPISNWLQKLLQIPGALKSHIDNVPQRFSKQFIQRNLLDRLEQKLIRWPIAGIFLSGIICALLFMLVGG